MLETVEYLRLNHQNGRIIVLVSRENNQLQVKLKVSKCDAIVLKPYCLDDLKTCMNEFGYYR